MIRVVLIAARRSFDRTAVRALLRFPQIDMRECDTAQGLADEMAQLSRAVVIVERAMLEPKLDMALIAFGARAIRIGDGAVIDLGRLANDLPLQLEQAFAAIVAPALTAAPTSALDARAAMKNLPSPNSSPQYVLVASSTGGPTALAALLTALPASAAPWNIAQHMPDHGSRSLAEHLAAVSGLPVRACGGGPVAPGINLLEGVAILCWPATATAAFVSKCRSAAQALFIPMPTDCFCQRRLSACRASSLCSAAWGRTARRAQRVSRRREPRFTCRAPRLAWSPECRVLRSNFAALRGLSTRKRHRRA